MKGHIIIDELFVPEDSVLEKTMIGNMISIKIEVGGSHTSLLEGQVDLTPFKVIAGVVAHFQRKRVFTPIETGVLALTIFYNDNPIYLHLKLLLQRLYLLGPLHELLLRKSNIGLMMLLLTLLVVKLLSVSPP